MESASSVATAIAFARSHIGDPYRFGATGPNEWDCSGLVMVAYAHGGVILPRTTGMMINVGTAVSREQLQPGDLVFPDFHHVQIYTGNGKIIEAPQTGEFVVERAMWGFWRARRVVNTVQSFSSNSIPVVGGAISGVSTAFDALSTVAKFVSDRHNWLRIAYALTGFVLILVALFNLETVVKTAGKVIPRGSPT
jgi:uncharacterized protein YycO